MIPAFRPLCALILALVLTLTGQAMAVARGAPGPAGQMVICSGSGPLTVSVDARGQPVGPRHICPDCLAGLTVGLLPAADALVRVLDPAAMVWPVVSVHRPAWRGMGASARAPPVSV